MHVLEMKTDRNGVTGRDDTIFVAGLLNGESVAQWENAHNKSETSYALPMIEIDVGYRLANDKDKAGPKPEGYMVLYNLISGFIKGEAVGSLVWDPREIYIVPIVPIKEQKHKALQNIIKDVQETLAKIESSKAIWSNYIREMYSGSLKTYCKSEIKRMQKKLDEAQTKLKELGD